MADSDPRSVVQRYDEAWDRSDTEGVLALYSDSVVIRGPGGLQAEGKQAARELVENMFAAYTAASPTEVLRQFVDGEYVISETRNTATHTGGLTLATGEQADATGRTLTMERVVIVRVVDGKIVEDTAYYDRDALLRQLGQVREVAQPV